MSSIARETLSDFAAYRPRATELAVLASLASSADATLLRRLRLRLAPHLGPDAEADLWFGSIVRTRGPEGIAFDPEIARLLRGRLADDPRREAAWEITAARHPHVSPAIAVEERVAWLLLGHDGGGDVPEAVLSRVEEELAPAMAALVREERGGVAHWARSALERLPAGIAESPAAWGLAVAAAKRIDRPRLFDGEPPAGFVERDLVEVLERTDDATLVLHHLGSEIVLGDVDRPHGYEIALPDTEPRIVDVIQRESGTERVDTVAVRAGEVKAIDALGDVVQVRTADGRAYQVGGEAPAEELRVWVDTDLQRDEELQPQLERLRSIPGIRLLDMSDTSMGLPPVEAAIEAAQQADAVLTFAGAIPRDIPDPQFGGDGKRTAGWMEAEAAHDAGTPVLGVALDEKALYGRVERGRIGFAEGVPAERVMFEHREWLRRTPQVVEARNVEEFGEVAGEALRKFTQRGVQPKRRADPITPRIVSPHHLFPAPEFWGREEELRRLLRWSESDRDEDRLLVVFGHEHEGKTALLAEFLRRRARHPQRGLTFVWSFEADPDWESLFGELARAASEDRSYAVGAERGVIHANLQREGRHLLVLDGVDAERESDAMGELLSLLPQRVQVLTASRLAEPSPRSEPRADVMVLDPFAWKEWLRRSELRRVETHDDDRDLRWPHDPVCLQLWQALWRLHGERVSEFESELPRAESFNTPAGAVVATRKQLLRILHDSLTGPQRAVAAFLSDGEWTTANDILMADGDAEFELPPGVSHLSFDTLADELVGLRIVAARRLRGRRAYAAYPWAAPHLRTLWENEQQSHPAQQAQQKHRPQKKASRKQRPPPPDSAPPPA